MSGRTIMRMPTTYIAALAGLLPLSACAGDNMGLASVNQPVVAGNGASVPNCPKWSLQTMGSAEATDPNYGCAINANLAAMIADPADLLRGRPYTGTDIETSTRAVRVWRDTAPSGKGGAIEKTGAKGGN